MRKTNSKEVKKYFDDYLQDILTDNFEGSLEAMAVQSMQSKIELDVSELSSKNIAQIMIWCDEKNYGYELKGDVLTVEFLKGFDK